MIIGIILKISNLSKNSGVLCVYNKGFGKCYFINIDTDSYWKSNTSFNYQNAARKMNNNKVLYAIFTFKIANYSNTILLSEKTD
jgi:hypothetical protein